MVEDTRDFEVLDAFLALLELVRDKRPNDRSALDRAYSVLTTDLEKSYLYLLGMVEMNGDILGSIVRVEA